MQAYALTAFGSESLETLSVPQPIVGPGQVLVRNKAAGVNNIDLLIRRGGVLPPEATPLPHILGVEGAGEIEEVGSDVEGFSVGDRVLWLGTLGAGGYGPYTAIDADYVAKIADNVSYENAAAAPVAYATARNIIFTYGAPERGSWVLVHSAAGGVGVAALQTARNAGLRTIALTTPGKFDFVKAQGAEVAIDRSASDVVSRIKEVTGDAGVALSLNSVAGGTIVQDLEVLGKFGQIISFGHLGGLPEGSAIDLLMPYFGKSVGIRVSDLYTMWGARKSAFSEMLRQVADDLASGAIVPQIHAALPVAAAIAAQGGLESGYARGKIILRHED